GQCRNGPDRRVRPPPRRCATDPETGAELPRGGIGMIELCGPNVFMGYWRLPDRPAAELPGVAGSAVIGLPHRDFGEGVTAAVVPTGSPALAEAELLTVLK
ncbi:hypothetical protein VB636_11915, partial [Paracoccus sp. APAP_BH8]